MNENRRSFMKDAIIRTTGLTLGSVASGGCSSRQTVSVGKGHNQNRRECRDINSSSRSKCVDRGALDTVELSMKSLLVLVSYHHRNTEKIADTFAKVLDAQIIAPQSADSDTLQEYGLVGFGSGIYDQKHHKFLLDLANKLPQVTNRKAFVFSTSGISRKFALKHSEDIEDPHTVLREILQSKGYAIVDEFNCTGWNTNSFLKLIGGMNKGKPNAEDHKNAEEFARNLMLNVYGQ